MILLMESDSNGKCNIRRPKCVYDDRDLAVCECARLNQSKSAFQSFYLEDIIFYGKETFSEFMINRNKGEVTIEYDNGSKVYVDVTLNRTTYDEHYHQEKPPREVPTYEVKSIKICGTDLDDLNLSEDMVKSIKHEADNYKEEMIESI